MLALSQICNDSETLSMPLTKARQALVLGTRESEGAARLAQELPLSYAGMSYAHTPHQLWYHFAWSTKYRKKIWVDDQERAEVKQLFRNIAEQYDMEVGTIELLSDHIHLTLTAPPRIAPARAAQILKSISTKALLRYYPQLRKQYWGGEIWVRGYFVRSAGPGLTKEQIDQYIREQTEER